MLVATTNVKYNGHMYRADDELPEDVSEKVAADLLAAKAVKEVKGRRATAPVVPASEEVGESGGAQATPSKVPVKQEAPKGTGGQVSKSVEKKA